MANKNLKEKHRKICLHINNFLNIIISDNETIYNKLDKIEKSNDLLMKYKLATEILNTTIPDT